MRSQKTVCAGNVMMTPLIYILRREAPDAEMICYPVVLQCEGRHIMYYNGNGYGLNGICLAVEE